MEQKTREMIAEGERKMLEIQLRDALERIKKLESALKATGKTQEDIHGILYRYRPDEKLISLEARIKVLEAENEHLRNVNMALAEGKEPEEVVIATAIPEKKIKNPGRPSITLWDAGQMRKLRKDGWTVREIADRFGRSVGAVQKIVANVNPDPESIEKHRAERNAALAETRKAKRATHKKNCQ